MVGGRAASGALAIPGLVIVGVVVEPDGFVIDDGWVHFIILKGYSLVEGRMDTYLLELRLIQRQPCKGYLR